MKLGSLFDGSGGFPLAGVLNGVEPVWASEIEPYPLTVTAARFPNMKQLGNVTKINGAVIEPVDIITFGSPCQDLSSAGKQAGIHAGQRSNLFFEAVRIIKEMRAATDGKYPRFAVWENVKGAFSSNGGADFQAVLQSLCEIKDPPQHPIPLPKNRKWKPAGCIVGNGFSIAWRTYDAQFWGTPQRRERIYLIADFSTECAGEILFEREGLSRDFEQGSEAQKGIALDTERSVGGGYFAFGWANGENAGLTASDTVYPTLLARRNGEPAVVIGCDLYNGALTGDKAATLGANSGTSANHAGPSVIILNDQGGAFMDVSSDVVSTLRAQEHGHQPIVCYGAVYDARGNGNGQIAPTLTGDHENRVTDYTSVAVFRMQAFGQYESDGTTSTLKARDYKDNTDLVVQKSKKRKYIVRRLIPLECGRLQGFPDWWTLGTNGSDTAIYKMWGNGIALPCAVDVLWRIVKTVVLFGRWERRATQ